MIRQDIEAARNCALIDPLGDLVERIAATIPARRATDAIYFNVPDPAQAVLVWVAGTSQAVSAIGTACASRFD